MMTASAGYHIIVMTTGNLEERNHVIVIKAEKTALKSQYFNALTPERMALKEMKVKMAARIIQTCPLIQECP